MYKELMKKLLQKKTLKPDEIFAFLEAISTRSMTIVEQAAVLVALESKGITPAELKAAVLFFQKRMTNSISLPETISICETREDSGLAFLSHVNTFLLSCLRVANVKSGGPSLHNRDSFGILKKLGVALDKDVATTKQIADKTGLAFLSNDVFYPILKTMQPVQKALSMRTLLSLVTVLLNPAKTNKQIIATRNIDKMELMAETCKLLGRKQVMIVCGADGVSGVSLSGKTTVVELLKGNIKKYTLTPASFGAKKYEYKELDEYSEKKKSKIVSEIITGNGDATYSEWVLMNTALALKFSGQQKSLKKCYKLARHKIMSGALQLDFESYLQATHMPSKMLDVYAKKRIEMENRKKKLSLKKIISMTTPSRRDFKKSLVRYGLSLIAEITRKIESGNVLISSRDKLKKTAKIYELAGVAAISVCTDKMQSGGSLQDLADVETESSITPLLCNDFIVDEYQIYEARYYGADAVILMASILSEQEIERFLNISRSLQMDVLCEVQNEKELKKILRTSANIIGINNLNMHNLKVDLETTKKLIKKIPHDKIVVSEHGFSARSQVLKLAKGVDAILLGERLIKHHKISSRIEQLVGKPQTMIKICGVKSLKEAKFCEKMGVDFIGLNLNPLDKNMVSFQLAKKICEEIKRNNKSATRVVGIFDNQPVDDINKASQMIGIDFVQLSSKHTFSFLRRLKKHVILKLHLTDKKALNLACKFSKVVDYVVFDGHSSTAGQGFSHGLARGFQEPFLISGGMDASNIQAFVQLVQPNGVDICLEDESSEKARLQKIEQLCSKLRG